MGLSGTGTFTQSGGTNSCGSLTLGSNAGSGGTYNLNGGLLVLATLGQGLGTAAFNFNGGTLGRRRFFQQPAHDAGRAAAATFDTAGFVVNLSGALSGPGSLTKVDSGTLVLSGPDSYSGGTIVLAGTLEFTNSNALPDGSSLTVGAGGGWGFSVPACRRRA